jgi:hypothetical protein
MEEDGFGELDPNRKTNGGIRTANFGIAFSILAAGQGPALERSLQWVEVRSQCDPHVVRRFPLPSAFQPGREQEGIPELGVRVWLTTELGKKVTSIYIVDRSRETWSVSPLLEMSRSSPFVTSALVIACCDDEPLDPSLVSRIQEQPTTLLSKLNKAVPGGSKLWGAARSRVKTAVALQLPLRQRKELVPKGQGDAAAQVPPNLACSLKHNTAEWRSGIPTVYSRKDFDTAGTVSL